MIQDNLPTIYIKPYLFSTLHNPPIYPIQMLLKTFLVPPQRKFQTFHRIQQPISIPLKFLNFQHAYNMQILNLYDHIFQLSQLPFSNHHLIDTFYLINPIAYIKNIISPPLLTYPIIQQPQPTKHPTQLPSLIPLQLLLPQQTSYYQYIFQQHPIFDSLHSSMPSSPKQLDFIQILLIYMLHLNYQHSNETKN